MGIFSRKKGKTPAPPGAVPAHLAGPTPAPPPPTSAPSLVPWEATKFKVQLKMAKSRVEIQRGKKENEIEATRRVVAQHLSNNKETLARIQGERVLRERSQVEALTIMETLIDELTNYNNFFTNQRDFDSVPSHIKETTASVVYACNRINVVELQVVVQMLRSHFSPAVIDPITQLSGPHVSHINKRLADHLDGNAPDGYLVLEELSRIAVEHSVSWIPPPEDINLDTVGGFRPRPGPPPSGGYGGLPTMAPSAPAPTNIPGMDMYGAQPPIPPGDPYAQYPASEPSAPSSISEPSAPPAYDIPPPTGPYDHHPPPTGSLYPYPGGHDSGQPGGMPNYGAHPGGRGPGHGPPGAEPRFLGNEALGTDDELDRRFRDIQNDDIHRRG